MILKENIQSLVGNHVSPYIYNAKTFKPGETPIYYSGPYWDNKETEAAMDAFLNGRWITTGESVFKFERQFGKRFNTKYSHMVNSGSSANLVLIAALKRRFNWADDDEIIVSPVGFATTISVIHQHRLKPVFVDIEWETLNFDLDLLELKITPKTKAIVPVHYAGVACDMDIIMDLSNKYGLFVIEDAAQAIDGFYKGKDGVNRALGSIGHLAAFSFHETKNIISGEGGMLVINDIQFAKRSEVIWEKGTNRSSFFRGEVDKYGWVDIGSSFLPSEIIAAFLWAQLQNIQDIQKRRNIIWDKYFKKLKPWAEKCEIGMPFVPDYASNNAHMFYLICKNLKQRTQLINFLKSKNIFAVFHYISLHTSPFYENKHDGRILPETDSFTNSLLRLPFYYELNDKDQEFVIANLIEFEF
jgi:dTDP-4-amino-4,6-dideoxygalactose transaminase